MLRAYCPIKYTCEPCPIFSYGCSQAVRAINPKRGHLAMPFCNFISHWCTRLNAGEILDGGKGEPIVWNWSRYFFLMRTPELYVWDHLATSNRLFFYNLVSALNNKLVNKDVREPCINVCFQMSPDKIVSPSRIEHQWKINCKKAWQDDLKSLNALMTACKNFAFSYTDTAHNPV